MGDGEMTGYIIASVALIAAVSMAVYCHIHTSRTISHLDEMLTAAIDGSFSEKTFSESRMSALENRLSRYLAVSTLSARNLQNQRDQISTLISDISHQTKTPVSNLRLYSQLLEEQPLPPAAQNCVRAISSQTGKLQSLIEALVKTSRLETGILALQPEPAEVAPVVRRAIDQYLPKAKGKNVTLTFDDRDGSAVFDTKWTEEAVCNLLDNAVKYTPSGGSVNVSVANYEAFCVVIVTDTGPGIPEEEHSKIFGRFYRSPTARQIDGVGIGLYLTRQIATGQGGYLKVVSGPGYGSTFCLYLPREHGG